MSPLNSYIPNIKIAKLLRLFDVTGDRLGLLKKAIKETLSIWVIHPQLSPHTNSSINTTCNLQQFFRLTSAIVTIFPLSWQQQWRGRWGNGAFWCCCYQRSRNVFFCDDGMAQRTRCCCLLLLISSCSKGTVEVGFEPGRSAGHPFVCHGGGWCGRQRKKWKCVVFVQSERVGFLIPTFSYHTYSTISMPIVEEDTNVSQRKNQTGQETNIRWQCLQEK